MNNMAAARIGGLLISLLIYTASGVYLDTQEGDVRLVGGDTGIEGRAQVYHDDKWVNICFSRGDEHEWEYPQADVFCEQLGYTRGSALILNGIQTAANYGHGVGDTYLVNVNCDYGTNGGLLGCADVQWGPSCDNDLGLVGIVCRVPGFVGCYNYPGPGVLLDDHQIIIDRNTLDKCIDGCQKAPGPFKYAALVQRLEDGTGIITNCNCGSSSSGLPAREDDHACYEPCPGDETQTCGAYNRAAVYDLESMRSGLTASQHIVWPSWGTEYTFSDNGKFWRIDIGNGYDYAVLHLLSFNMADQDYIVLSSESRSPGTSLNSRSSITLPYRWVTQSATWFEVRTRVQPTSPGDHGFIIYYEFGMHCDARDLPDIDGGSLDYRRSGVYYERQCPAPFCAPGYEASSQAICQLNGTWTGTPLCSLIPTPRRTLFPPRDSTTPTPIPDKPSTTPSAESTTPPPPPPPPITPTTPPPTTPRDTTQPPPTTTLPPQVTPSQPPPTQPPPQPPAECILPELPPYGEYLGTSGRAVFYETNSITHCCVHNYYEENCLVLTCQSNGVWENGEYLERCEPTACPLPVTNSYGSLGGTDDNTVFVYGDEISLCCIYSDYCHVLRCRSDGTWDNGDELLGCPGPRPPPPDKDNALPIWVIILIVAAIIIGLIMVGICVCVICLRPRHRNHDDKRVLRDEYRKDDYRRDEYRRDDYRRDEYRKDEYRERNRYPPPLHYIHDDDYPREHHWDRNQRSRDPRSEHKTPLGPSVARPSKDPRDYTEYAKYGARPLHNVPDQRDDYNAPRRQQSGRKPSGRQPSSGQPSGREPSPRRTERRSDRSRPRTETDEASALGALNSVVQDFDDGGSGY